MFLCRYRWDVVFIGKVFVICRIWYCILVVFFVWVWVGLWCWVVLWVRVFLVCLFLV